MKSNVGGTPSSVQGLDRSASLRILAGQSGDRKDIRFREAIVDYRTLLEHAGGTADPFPAACLRRWGDRWLHRTLRSITPQELEAYFAELTARGHGRGEIRREKRLLSSFYRWARRCGWTEGDPARGATRSPALPDKPATAWTASEQRRLLDVCRGSPASQASGESPAEAFLYPLILLGLRTGLPMGVLLDLEWRHVDLERARIVVPAHETPDGRPIDAPIDYDALDALTVLRRRAHDLLPPPRRVFEAIRIPFSSDRTDELAVLAAFRRARRLAGIPDGDFRSLRKSFLRNCARAGVPRQGAARMCDGTDPKLLREAYGKRLGHR